MKQEGPTIHIGPPAWGCDFFDRKETITECREKLAGSSIILSAPRRYGKSSVMLYLRDNPGEEFFPIYFELEDHFRLTAFINEFVIKILESDESLRKKFTKRFAKVFGKVEEVSFWKFKIKLKKSIDTDDDWEEWTERIKQLIVDLLENKSKKLLFIFDEFPLMLHNFINKGEAGENEAVKVLQWLRKLRHETPFLEQVRFIFGGSVGIEKVISYIKATRTINDLQIVNIGPFAPPEAEDFIRKILTAEEIEVSDKIVKSILKVTGTYIPIYLQILLDSVIKESRCSGRKISPQLIEECYEKKVHGPEYKCYFEDYYERLWRYYPDEEAKSARRMLKELAAAENGMPADRLFYIYGEAAGSKGSKDKFDLLLSALESDFYIERDQAAKTVYFRNKWLQDWWRMHHGG